MTDLHSINPPVTVTVADGRTISISQQGTLTISVVIHDGKHARTDQLTLRNVYIVPTLPITLISVSQLVRAGDIVRFEDNYWSVKRGQRRRELLHAREVDGVYEVDTPDTLQRTASTSQAFASVHVNASLSEWHRRLGHLNYSDCRRLADSGAVDGISITEEQDEPVCQSCALAKVTRAPAPQSRTSSDEIADRVCHMDLSGPVARSYQGNEYFMVVVWRDYVTVYGLKHKSEASQYAKRFLRFIHRQAGVPESDIQVVRTDGGTEFLGPDFRKIVAAEGLRHQYATRYRSSQNGVAERAIRTLTEMAAAMLIESKLPHYLWEFALTHAAYIRNRVPKRTMNITPHERLFGVKPKLNPLPVFGQTMVVRTPDPLRRKNVRFDGRGNLGAFVGFSEEIRGFRVYVVGDGRPVKETTDVVTLDTMLADEIVLDDDQPLPDNGDSTAVDADVEHSEPSRAEAARRVLQDTSLPREQVEEVNGTSELTRVRRSERLSARHIDSAFILLTEIIREPLNMAEARRSPQWTFWEKAIIVEIKALMENNTFTLVDPPLGAHILDNTVQFRLKTGPDGEIKIYKARVCATGDKQIFLLDYVETRAPVADIVCVRIFFVLAARRKMHVRQGDVPAAYLKADIKETVFVRQVKGFEKKGAEKKVWLLNKALYGLKQAGREWHHEIDSFLLCYGLKAAAGDECLYYMNVANDLLLVCLYVDDILIGHPDESQVIRLMAALNIKYQVKNLGAPSQFLGMHIERPNDDEFLISQSAYIQEALYRFAMLPVRPTPTPMVPHTRLDTLTSAASDDEVAEMRKVPYRQVVGSLLYLARVSRPDIGFTVNQLARHCSSPRKQAWDAAKFLMRYLGGSQKLKLQIKPNKEGLALATDADFANDLEDRRSVSGYVITLFGAPIAWGSTKQSVIAQSSTAAEFIAANDGLLQAEWMKLTIDEILHDIEKPIKLTMFIDNLSTIHRIKKEGSSNSQKAVDIRFHALKDAWRHGGMAIEYISTKENPADIMTKALARTELWHKRDLCGQKGKTASG